MQQTGNQVSLVLIVGLILIFSVALDVSLHLASFLSKTGVRAGSGLIVLTSPR